MNQKHKQNRDKNFWRIKQFYKVVLVFVFSFFFISLFSLSVQAQRNTINDYRYLQFPQMDEELKPTSDFVELQPIYSFEGYIVDERTPKLVMVVDEYPSFSRTNHPFEYSILSTKSNSNFDITFIDEGGKDTWGNDCFSFPTTAIDAIIYSSNIWSTILDIKVPIKVQACWTSLESN